MGKEATVIAEPPADPTKAAKPVKRVGSRLDLPLAKSVPDPPKVSPRVEWEVIAQLNGFDYGPFTVKAVDESEAITRVLDSPDIGRELKPHSLSLRYKVKRKSS